MKLYYVEMFGADQSDVTIATSFNFESEVAPIDQLGETQRASVGLYNGIVNMYDMSGDPVQIGAWNVAAGILTRNTDDPVWS